MVECIHMTSPFRYCLVVHTVLEHICCFVVQVNPRAMPATAEDMDGVARALIRLQRTYDIGTADMAKGQVECNDTCMWL